MLDGQSRARFTAKPGCIEDVCTQPTFNDFVQPSHLWSDFD